MTHLLISPEYIQPLRMALRVPAETSLRFSVLNFPYAQALKTFMVRFKEIYKHHHREPLPHYMHPPFRQLNDALLALAPGLIQGFEGVKGGDKAVSRMVTFTRFEDGHAEDFPSLEQLTTLIRIWLERWAGQPEVRTMLQKDGKAAWEALLRALNGNPEAEWEHDRTAHPAGLARNPGENDALGFLALPALLTALLHDRTMVIQRPQGTLSLTWRRAHDGGKNGLHLVSQPIPYRDDYFAYRLDFSVQTQAGYPGSWIFAYLSIQRYIGERYRNGDKKRAISILVGHNRERFTGGWDTDTTLIRLPVKRQENTWHWASGVGGLLDDYAIRRLEAPETILNAPIRYGHYNEKPDGDEYYVIYAEGRKFSDKSERGREHQTRTGVTLRERSQIIEGVMVLLDGWLEKSAPFRKDMQKPRNTLALRDYEYMVDKHRKDQTAQRASWRAALETSLTNSDATHVHLVVLYRTPEFYHWAQAQIEEVLMGVEHEVPPLATVTFKQLPLLLYAPLDPGDHDPAIYFLPADKKPKGWMASWREQMRVSYGTKREEWGTFLAGLGWRPGARRLLLIDSTGERGANIPDDQKIKGAVRDACHRKSILSQFIVGDDLRADKKYNDGRLDKASQAKLRNAVLDLVVRQQGILYAPPHEIYTRAARLDAEIASQLDVISFCRVERLKPFKLNYVLAVRLRASGEVSVMLPDDTTRWIPYDIAAQMLGKIYSEERPARAKASEPPRLRLGHRQMLNFAHNVLTKQLERPTIAVIEAERWRNASGWNETHRCWTQLTNPQLFEHRTRLRFDAQRCYDRAAPLLDPLLGVVRLRMGTETPQYVTAENWDAKTPLRDIPHLTGYVDPQVPELLHYFSVARLSETQKRQKNKHILEAFRSDIRAGSQHDLAVKHPQLIELVPFFVHPRYQSDEGQRQLCRCIHFLRNSPGFTSGETLLPYPMHLGEKLIRDQLVIIGAND